MNINVGICIIYRYECIAIPLNLKTLLVEMGSKYKLTVLRIYMKIYMMIFRSQEKDGTCISSKVSSLRKAGRWYGYF